jgi:hypothetical protein
MPASYTSRPVGALPVRRVPAKEARSPRGRHVVCRQSSRGRRAVCTLQPRTEARLMRSGHAARLQPRPARGACLGPRADEATVSAVRDNRCGDMRDAELAALAPRGLHGLRQIGEDPPRDRPPRPAGKVRPLTPLFADRIRAALGAR